MIIKFLNNALVTLLLLATFSAQSGLILREVDGVKMVYDEVKDITWLLDANYVKTSGYNDSGILTWADALAWAGNLSVAGYSDWRLPTIKGQLSCNGTFSFVDGGFCGFNANTDASELSHMYYVNLQNNGKVSTDGSVYSNFDQYNLAANLNSTFIDTKTGKLVSIENFGVGMYWTGRDYFGIGTWAFWTTDGAQIGVGSGSLGGAWAVRDGDVVETRNDNAVEAMAPSVFSMFALASFYLVFRRKSFSASNDLWG